MARTEKTAEKTVVEMKIRLAFPAGKAVPMTKQKELCGTVTVIMAITAVKTRKKRAHTAVILLQVHRQAVLRATAQASQTSIMQVTLAVAMFRHTARIVHISQRQAT